MIEQIEYDNLGNIERKFHELLYPYVQLDKRNDFFMN